VLIEYAYSNGEHHKLNSPRQDILDTLCGGRRQKCSKKKMFVNILLLTTENVGYDLQLKGMF